MPPTIHASYWPTIGVRSGQPVTFFVRTRRTTFGEETWDFGDGSAPASVKSDGCAVEKAKEGYARMEHVFQSPGDYLVKVEARERARREGDRAPVGSGRKMIRLLHSCHSWRSGVGLEILVTPLTEFDPFSDLGLNNPLSLRFNDFESFPGPS